MATEYRVTRFVPGDYVQSWLGRDAQPGEVLYECLECAYSCIGDGGISLTEDPRGGYPFFEFPRDAVEVVT